MERRVLAHSDGLGNAQVSLRVDDISQLKPDEYKLEVNSYTPGERGARGVIELKVTNSTTGVTQKLNPVDLAKTDRIDIPGSGLSLGIGNIIADDPLKAGKTFTLRPTRLAAHDMSLEQKDPVKVASADAEIKAVAAATNKGTGMLRTSAINNPLDPLYMDENNPLEIVIRDNTAGVISYDIVDKNGQAVTLPGGTKNSYNPPKLVGQTLTGLTLKQEPLTGKATFNLAGIEVEMYGGTPVAGDKFTLNYNETGDGDNRNMRKIADFQNQKLMNNNKSTIQDVYTGMLSELGTKTANADISMQSALIIKNQSSERMENANGVNMDEEAANLIQYQQHYSAAARIISIAGDLFDTILQSTS